MKRGRTGDTRVCVHGHANSRILYRYSKNHVNVPGLCLCLGPHWCPGVFRAGPTSHWAHFLPVAALWRAALHLIWPAKQSWPWWHGMGEPAPRAWVWESLLLLVLGRCPRSLCPSLPSEWKEVAPGTWEQENWPCPSPAEALGRADPVPHLGSTVWTGTGVAVQVNLLGGHESCG